MAVVVRGVLGQDARQVPFAGDEDPVGALAMYGADPTFCKVFALGTCGGVRITSTPAAANTASKATVNFVSPISQQEP